MSNQFSNYLGRKVLEEKCEIHQIPMWEIKNPANPDGVSKMCEECQRLAIEKKANQLDNDSYANHILATTFRVFERESIISPELAEASFDNFEITSSFDQTALNFTKRASRHYYEGGGGNTVFMGEPGVGKSHLSVAMARSLNDAFKIHDMRQSIIFMPVSRLMSLVTDAIDNKQSKYTAEYAIKLLTDCHYLFLDDLGKESCTGNHIKPASAFTYKTLFSILDARDKVIVNTNFSRSELIRIYDEAFVDRIFKGNKRDGLILNFPKGSESKRFR